MNLPECDVLGVDCEGAELEIRRALEFRPRLLVVEAHPHLGCPLDAVEALLADLGYTIVAQEPIGSDRDIVIYAAIQGSP